MAFQLLSLLITLLMLTLFPMILASRPPHSHQYLKPSPFAFFKHLQGCHKGDKLQGVHDLKTYLDRFGYLNYPSHKQARHVDDDIFDDELEFALKTYQLNYNLKPTGILDAKTIDQMSMPRCGVADIINGTTRMRSGETKHHHHGNFHTVSHFSFFPGSPRWPPNKSHLTYAFLPTVPTNARGAVTRAFNNWAANTHFTFSQVSNPQTADMKVSFERGDHGDGAPFDGAGRVIAHAFAPTDGRFHYDADERYAVGAVSGAYDLETVALHEIGHLLGLGHSSVQGAIMWSGIAMGVTKGLHANDIAGIRTLYNI